MNLPVKEGTTGTPVVRSRISVYWPLKHHVNGTVNSIIYFDHCVMFDDNDSEKLNAESQKWNFEENDEVIAAQPGFKTASKINWQDFISDIFDFFDIDFFDNKLFMSHQAQPFHQAPMVSSYNDEERKFVSYVKKISRSDVPNSSKFYWLPHDLQT